MKIGILGGTFNPIHIGHLILAEEVKDILKLDRIIFVPTDLPPHKQNSEIIDAKERYKMIKLAIKGNKDFSVSDIEIKRKGVSYTIETLKEFKKIYPRDFLYFITGSDLLKYLDEWKDLNQILEIVNFVVATRPSYPLEMIPSYIKTLEIRAIDVSGFQIRKNLKEGRSIRYLVPELVFKYIKKKGLYK